MTATMEPAGVLAPKPSTPPRRRPGRLVRRGFGLRIYTWLVILWLMIPILVIIAFGFNNTKGKFNYTWQGFTFRWYENLFAYQDLTQALVNSLTIAVIVTAISTVLGTGMGFALGRWRFRGSGVTELTLFANIAAPEITL